MDPMVILTPKASHQISPRLLKLMESTFPRLPLRPNADDAIYTSLGCVFDET